MSISTINVCAVSRSGFTFQTQAGVHPFPVSSTELILVRGDLPAGPLHMVLILLLFLPASLLHRRFLIVWRLFPPLFSGAFLQTQPVSAAMRCMPWHCSEASLPGLGQVPW